MYAPFARSDYYEDSAPSDGPQSASDLPTAQTGCLGCGRPRMVPTFTTPRSARSAPSSAPTASPCLRRRPSAWPPHRRSSSASELTHTSRHPSRAAHRPRSTRFEPAPPLRDFNHWFASATPSGLARRTRTVWQYRSVPALSGLLPALPGDPRIRLPSASIRPLRRPNGRGLPPPLEDVTLRCAPPR